MEMIRAIAGWRDYPGARTVSFEQIVARELGEFLGADRRKLDDCVGRALAARTLTRSRDGAKREDWTAFMMGWLQRRLPGPLATQQDLFVGSSLTSFPAYALSTQEKRRSARSAQAMRLLKGGKP